MTAMTRTMLKDALDALVGLDLDKALRVKASDDAVDDLNRAMYQQVQKEIQKRPEMVELYIHFMGISRCLERIADLSTSISEDVVYLVSGAIARH
jgi:phosphate transport system protein